MDALAAQDFTGEKTRRLPLDRSLLRLTLEETAVFRECTGIDNEDVLLDHIHGVAADAYALFPYPCIRWYIFAKFLMARNPVYQYVVSQSASEGSIFVDIATGFATDLRKLVHDGYPTERIIAFDIRSEFWNLGHRLFRSNSSTFPVRFVQGNIFDLEAHTADPDTNPAATDIPASLSSLEPIMGKASVIHAGFFFHLFTCEDQERIARIFSRLLSRRSGAIIFGSHNGLPQTGFFKTGPSGRSMFCHSPESWTKLWKDIFGEQVKVEAQLTVHPRRAVDTMASDAIPDGEEMASTPREFLVWSVTVV